MPKLADRVLETSVTEGTGAFTLDAAKTGYQRFATAFNDGDAVHYCITDGTDWETGIGVIATATHILTRSLVRKSTAVDNAAVDWGAGLKDVFCTATADAINRQRELIILYRLGL